MNLQKFSPLLTDKEIKELFYNTEMYEKNSFFVIEAEKGGYVTDRQFDSVADHIKYIQGQMAEGRTIIVKNMEDYNQNIIDACEMIGKDSDAHLYYVPEGVEEGEAFGWHWDEQEVWVHMIKGRKGFHKLEDGDIKTYQLEVGDTLNLPVRDHHKAIPMGPSVMMSFGQKIEKTNQEDA